MTRINADRSLIGQSATTLAILRPRGRVAKPLRGLGTMDQTISFRVVKEPYGWAVRMGDGMMTPFRSKVLAMRHANGFADALRGCGEPVEVVVEERPTEVRSFMRRRRRFLPFS